MVKRVYKIEKPHGRTNEDVFSVLDETELARYCPRVQSRLAHDPFIHEFRGELMEEAAEWSTRKRGLGAVFRRVNDPAFQRVNILNWQQCFADRDQIQAIFRHPKITPLMKQRGLELHEYQVDDRDVFRSPYQALFYRPDALLVGRYDLETGDFINTPITPDLRERYETVMAKLFKPRGP